MKNQLKKVQDIIALLLEGKQIEYKYKGEDYEWRLIDDWNTFSWIVHDIEDIEWRQERE